VKAVIRHQFRNQPCSASGTALGEGANRAYLNGDPSSQWRPFSGDILMTINTGDRIPDATLTTMTAEGPRPITTQDLFAGKTVALFAVPGAFTPTCSARHLPGFAENRQALADKGVDTVACISVNDAFVMGAWADSQGISSDKIVMLADGNGDFTRQIGLSMDAKGFGMGERSQRYSMLVRDGVVESLNVEQGGEFKVSSAEHLLGEL
jgi:peroxiredoxin